MDHIQMQPKKLPNKIKEIAKGKVQKGEKKPTTVIFAFTHT